MRIVAPIYFVIPEHVYVEGIITIISCVNIYQSYSYMYKFAI